MVNVIYPVPLDEWETFKGTVVRFFRMYNQYPPQVPHVLWLVLMNGGRPVPARVMMKAVWDLPDHFEAEAKYFFYTGTGLDIGAAQAVARHLNAQGKASEFLWCLTSRCYPHAPGWLERMAQARETHGPGLYGCSASRGGGNLHLCTRGHGLDAGDLAVYLDDVTDKRGGLAFEQNLLRWMEGRGHTARLVYYDGVWTKDEWFNRPNIYGRGDQSNMLLWDKHTDIYREADAQLKSELEGHILGKSEIRNPKSEP